MKFITRTFSQFKPMLQITSSKFFQHAANSHSDVFVCLHSVLTWIREIHFIYLQGHSSVNTQQALLIPSSLIQYQIKWKWNNKCRKNGLPVIALPASERALWPQHTTVSPSQRRQLATADMRHCARRWKAEGPTVGAPNTPPRTRTPPPPEKTHNKKRAVRSLSSLSYP